MKLPFWKDYCLICDKKQNNGTIILDLNTGSWTHKACEAPKKGRK